MSESWSRISNDSLKNGKYDIKDTSSGTHASATGSQYTESFVNFDHLSRSLEVSIHDGARGKKVFPQYSQRQPGVDLKIAHRKALGEPGRQIARTHPSIIAGSNVWRKDDSDSDDASSISSQTFSPSSSVSSASSFAENDADISSASQPGRAYTASGNINVHPKLLNPTTQSIVTSMQNAPARNAGVRQHPRRRPVSTTWTQPVLIRQHERRQHLVEKLVDSASDLVALSWPEMGAAAAPHCRIISLRYFIRETLRRSRTSYCTLQVALWYLVVIRPYILACYKKRTSVTPENGHKQSSCPAGFPAAKCGRRMFLSALILASKYLQDRNFTARAWSKITGLPAQEISSNESNYLVAIDWNLHMKEQDFALWNSIILHSTNSLQAGISFRETWSQILELIDSGSKLDQVVSALAFQRAWPSTSATMLSAGVSPGQLCGETIEFTPPSSRSPSFFDADFATIETTNTQKPLSCSPQNSKTPPQPNLGGNLKTPQLPPMASGPSHVMSSSEKQFSDQLCNNLTSMDCRRDDQTDEKWQGIRSEFPMDMAESPESLSPSENGNGASDNTRAVQNRVFGIVTPPSSLDGRVSRNVSPLHVPARPPQGASTRSASTDTSDSGDGGANQMQLDDLLNERAIGQTGQSQHGGRAGTWLNMLAMAAGVSSTDRRTFDQSTLAPKPKLSTTRNLSKQRKCQLQKTNSNDVAISSPAVASFKQHHPSSQITSDPGSYDMRAHQAQQSADQTIRPESDGDEACDDLKHQQKSDFGKNANRMDFKIYLKSASNGAENSSYPLKAGAGSKRVALPTEDARELKRHCVNMEA